MKTTDIYGLMAEFDEPGDIVHAAEAASKKGYRHMDAYTPIPIEELTDALSVRHTRLSAFVFLCAMTGGLLGFGMQYFASVIDYPLNVGGKPLNSWPQFIPITFEMTILFAAIGAVFGMLLRNGLPEPVHPVFNAPRFELATRDKFFLCIEATDPLFNREETERFLQSLKPANVTVVDH